MVPSVYDSLTMDDLHVGRFVYAYRDMSYGVVEQVDETDRAILVRLETGATYLYAPTELMSDGPDAYAQVQAGASLLDGIETDWYNKIDLDDLDLGEPSRCILGQVLGDYFRGLEKLFGQTFSAGDEAYGFYRANSDYEDLHDMWVDEIEHRRELEDEDAS